MPRPQLLRIVAVSIRHGRRSQGVQSLEMIVFLTPDGRLDQANCKTEQPILLRRNSTVTWTGRLICTDDGWVLRATNGEDTPLWRLGAQRLRPGEHLTLLAPDGDDLVFRVVNVTAVED
jgi:hypothetical protein